MKLKQLLEGLTYCECSADPEQEITGVCYDSRKAEPGNLFVAITGFDTDGHQFVPQAQARGVRVVVCERAPAQGEYIRVDSGRQALAQISANWFGHPAEKMKMIGVTGTNGKTTVTTVLKQVLQMVTGEKVGMIGTIQNEIGDRVIPTERTTPESYVLQKLLRQMYDEGCTYVVMEVSSHAIALARVAQIPFRIGVFTNLTEDHLDFHKTMENYAQTKAKLFAVCQTGIINLDDAYAALMCRAVQGKLVTTSIKQEADLRAQNITLTADNVSFDLCGREGRVVLPIPGSFTVYNGLAVIATALELGLELPQILRALEKVQSVKGRVEVVPTPGAPYTVVIDYAHTPDALENVLRSVRGYCKGRLIAVFGCGGDRDPIKRPLMGEIGVRCSDLAVITSDNPRTEAPGAIIDDILKGVSGNSYVVIENRREAIFWALEHAQAEDVIVLAGKGHETYQIIGTTKYHMDEREIVAEYFRK